MLSVYGGGRKADGGVIRHFILVARDLDDISMCCMEDGIYSEV